MAVEPRLSTSSRQRGLGRALETNLYGATYEGGTCHRQRLLGPLQAEAEDGELRGLGIEGDKTTREPQVRHGLKIMLSMWRMTIDVHDPFHCSECGRRG